MEEFGDGVGTGAGGGGQGVVGVKGAGLCCGCACVLGICGFGVFGLMGFWRSLLLNWD